MKFDSGNSKKSGAFFFSLFLSFLGCEHPTVTVGAQQAEGF